MSDASCNESMNYQAYHKVDEGTTHYDEEGYCILKLYETKLKSNKSVYIPLRKIANGRFSTVYLCRDINYKKYVAIKICQAGQSTEISKDEVEILQEIYNKCNHLEDNGGIVELLDSFEYHQETVGDVFADDSVIYKNYYCIVFELLGHSVFRLLTRYTPNINYNKAIPMPIVKTIAKNLLQSVHYLHEAGIIHTDLKPENLAMSYYLPLLDEQYSYELEDLLYGPESEQIFDAKLSTPAVDININDYECEDKETKGELKQYLEQLGYLENLNTWDEVKNNLMSKTDYKEKFREMVSKYGSAEVSDRLSSYYINGMNIFNLKNLIKTAEEIFRLQPLPTDSGLKYDTIEISSANETHNFLVEPTIADRDQEGKSSVAHEDALLPVGQANLIAKLFDAREILLNASAADVSNVEVKYQYYTILEGRKILPDRKLFIAENEIKYGISYDENMHSKLNEILETCCCERLNFDENNSKSLVKISRSGLHSRLELEANLNKAFEYTSSSEESSQVRHIELPAMTNPNQIKCFGLTDNGHKIYPTLISYYSKKQLIPFCPEMFKIKIIDLGNACYIDRRFSSVIETINYRAPEIIVGYKSYSEKVDEFSAGCIIFELLTGNVLFNPRVNGNYDPLYHLQLIIQTVGEEGMDWLIRNCQQQAFLSDGKFAFKQPLQFRSISTQLVNDYGFEQQTALSVEQLIKPLMLLDPEKRETCGKLVNNTWLNSLGQGDFLVGYDGRQ